MDYYRLVSTKKISINDRFVNLTENCSAYENLYAQLYLKIEK